MYNILIFLKKHSFFMCMFIVAKNQENTRNKNFNRLSEGSTINNMPPSKKWRFSFNLFWIVQHLRFSLQLSSAFTLGSYTSDVGLFVAPTR